MTEGLTMLARLIAVVALTVSSAVIQGRLSYRWETPESLQRGVEFVEATPKRLGKWEVNDDVHQMSERVIRMLGITGYIGRGYTAGENQVSLLLMTGRTGKLILHTPDICYQSIGNNFLSGPTPREIVADGVRHEFLTLPVRPAGELDRDFVVVYGFLHDGVFSATRTPRLAFHGAPHIEKIQVLCSVDPSDATAIPAPAQDFLLELCRYCNQAAVK